MKISKFARDEITDKIICSICDKVITRKESHNPAPLAIKGRVCEDCFYSKVIPVRLEDLELLK